jgi:CDP-diacylglycerol--glycerol-3-phosphate 3-phosphatidyltransferase
MNNGDNAAEAEALSSLYRRWWLFAVVCLILLASGFLLIWTTWSPEYAARWLFLPFLTASYLLFVLRRNLSANHRQGERELLPTLGWGNQLTLLRGLLVAGMTGFLLLPRPLGWLGWLPGLLYVLSDACDFFDGYVARVTNHATRLGEILDMRFDGFGVLAAALLAVHYLQVPLWYLAVAFAYPLFLAGVWLRRKLSLQVYPIPPSGARRLFAGLQMGFLAVVLLPIFSPPGTHIAATLFALPLLINFLTDWLHVTGFLGTDRLPQDLQSWVSGWLPLVLRFSVLALNLAAAIGWLAQPGQFSPSFLLLNGINLILVGMLVLGVMPRIAAIFALSMLGFFQIFEPLSAAQVALAIIYTAILYLGAGRYSLWTPEEHLFHRRVGDKVAQTPSNALEQGI